MFRILSTAIVHQNPWFRVRLHTVERDGSSCAEYYVIDGRPFCLIIAEEEEKLLLVEQYRFPTDETTIEFPMGGIEPREEPAVAAAREFREETGYVAETLIPLGSISSLNGNCSTMCHLFVACGVRRIGDQELEASESGMRVFWLSTKEWREKIASGTITDGKSLAAWAIFTAWKQRAPRAS